MSFDGLLTVTAEQAPSSAEERRQKAWAIAQACVETLKRDCGATEVIIFGSLRGDTPWHSQSDLDLAVRGMTSDDIWNAFPVLEKVVPSWLPFDLVAVDRASERIRDRILQITPMPENKYLALKLRLEDELVAISKTIETLNKVLADASTVANIFVTPALASYSEDFYSGCEHLAERIAVELDGALPKGKNWHEQLLLQVSESGGEERPPLWDKPLLKKLDEYRRFRHRVRHLYNFDLDDKKVLDMARRAAVVFEEIEQAVATFSEWLVHRARQ